MAYRYVYIYNRTKIRVKGNSLILDNGEIISIPLNDIKCLMIDNPLSNIDSSSLLQLSNNNICTFICDRKHLPASQIVSLCSGQDRRKRITQQLSISKDALDAIWQNITINKIINQAICLKNNGRNHFDRLMNLSKSVKFGDTANCGSIRILVVTQRQYDRIELLVGDTLPIDIAPEYEQLTLV